MSLGRLGLLRKIRDFKNAGNRDFILKILPKQSICAEIGVSEGKFSKRIVKITDPSKLYLIDMWSVDAISNKHLFNHTTTQKMYDEYFASVSETFIGNDNVVIIRGKSKDVLNTFSDSFLDWIYIDGSHFYEDISSDLEVSINKVKSNGLILGDDYFKRKDGWKDDVIRAVNDFVNKHDLKLQIFDDQFIIKIEKP